MSQASTPVLPSEPELQPVPSRVLPARRRTKNPAGRLVLSLGLVMASGAAVFYGVRAYRSLTAAPAATMPTAKVKRGDLSLSITAKADLRGGNPETLTAPMIGTGDMHITFLRTSGDQAKAGDIVVQLNTSEQVFKLKEAEADLAEAEQHVLQAAAQRDADKEEDAYALKKAKSDVTLAELDVRKNPLLPAIVAKQNDLALASARDHLAQLEKNVANRQATSDAGIAIQDAGKAKAEAQIKTARENIEAMTVRAHHAGYVALKTISPMMLTDGMVLPEYQMGDTVHPGMAIAEIPNFSDWELGGKMDELDRGHVAVGDKVAITIIAVPNRKYHGHVKDLGGVTGGFFGRHFEIKVALDDPTPELRPGMNANIVVTTDEMRNVLWLPAQALFEADGRTFVYARAGKSFVSKDVKLIRRNETRAIISGLAEGQEVALANPAEVEKKGPANTSALKSIAK